jgi:hypothetical protein
MPAINIPSDANMVPMEFPVQFTPTGSTPFSHSAVSAAAPLQNLIGLDIVSERESHDLVELYWTHCHSRGPVLDRELHKYESLRAAHPFLFNCICAVAARFYRYNFTLSEKIIEAVTAQLQQVVFSERPKIETAQGLFLLAHWHGRGSTDNYGRAWMIANSVHSFISIIDLSGSYDDVSAAWEGSYSRLYRYHLFT